MSLGLRRIIAGLGVAAIALIGPLSSAAPAHVPNGNGLVTVAAFGITSISCTNGVTSATQITTTRGDGSSFWFANGSHVVKSWESFTSRFGTVTKTFGQKTGLAGSTVTCTFSGSNPYLGAFSGTVRGVLVRG